MWCLEGAATAMDKLLVQISLGMLLGAAILPLSWKLEGNRYYLPSLDLTKPQAKDCLETLKDARRYFAVPSERPPAKEG